MISYEKRKIFFLNPWIILRLRLLFCILSDLIIGFFCFLLDNYILRLNTNINYFLLIFIWIIISYITGKYKAINDKFKFFTNKSYFKSICISSSLTLSIYALSTKTIFNLDLPFIKVYYLFSSISLIIIFSGILDYIINTIYFINNKNKNIWYFFKSRNDKDFILDFLKQLRENSKYNFLIYKEDIYQKNNKKIPIIIKSYESLNAQEKEEIKFLKSKNIKILTILEWSEFHLNRIPSEIIELNKNFKNKFKSKLKKKKLSLAIKRLLDVLFSLFLLIISSPIIIFSILIIWLQDFQNVFYKQKRTGLNGKEITIYKLRSMKINSENEGLSWASKDDPRITKFGRLIRKSRIDELPQLINVIKGDMTLIGPRPERPEIDKELIDIIPNYFFRYSIKPGLSGWAQVNYNYAANLEEVKNKLSYDIFYIKNFSLFLDILIFLKTIRLILNLQGSETKKKSIEKI